MSGECLVADAVSAESAEQTVRSGWFGWSDWAGMVASVGCAIHCAAMPFVIAYLPTLGLSFLADEAFHQWMAVGCLTLAFDCVHPGASEAWTIGAGARRQCRPGDDLGRRLRFCGRMLRVM